MSIANNRKYVFINLWCYHKFMFLWGHQCSPCVTPLTEYYLYCFMIRDWWLLLKAVDTSRINVYLFTVIGMSMTINQIFDISLTDPDSKTYKDLSGKIESAVSILCIILNEMYCLCNLFKKKRIFSLNAIYKMVISSPWLLINQHLCFIHDKAWQWPFHSTVLCITDQSESWTGTNRFILLFISLHFCICFSLSSSLQSETVHIYYPKYNILTWTWCCNMY